MSLFYVGQKIRASDLEAAFNPPWVAYTPLWSASGTQPSLGDGTLVGRYWRVGTGGNKVTAEWKLTIGSTTTFGTGAWFISVPFTASADSVTMCVGVTYYIDLGTQDKVGCMKFEDTTRMTLVAASGGTVTPTNPMPWATGDYARGQVTYEPA